MYVKALEVGLSCIPCNAKTGRPLFDEWQQYSFRLPSIDEAEEWEKRYPIGDIYGITLVCGQASGIEAIDIDTDDPNAHKIIPKSIYGKRGLPGRATYFFKWDEKHYNIGEGTARVGLYHNCKNTILPPSKHRKFDGHYLWLGKSIFELDRDELPHLDSLEFFNKLPQSTSSEFNGEEGRNNMLVRAITAMRSEGKSEEEIVDWVYEWDLREHKPRLFTDPKENYKAKNEDEAHRAAHKMVASVTRSLLSKNVAVVLPSKRKTVDVSFDIDKFEPRSYPMPSRGFIRVFSDAANASSRFDVTSLALGGAISTLSAICANRVKFSDIWSNTYIAGLASSGLGKGSVVQLMNNLLAGTGLIGAAMYRSSQSFVEDLHLQPQRIDIIDEAAPFFESMKSSATYTSDLADIVNRLYSSSSMLFNGISSVRHGKRKGACNNPCISIYATVHQTGFLRAVQGYLGNSGLMPRFLIFEELAPKRVASRLDDEGKLAASMALKDFIRRFGDLYPYVTEPMLCDTENLNPKVFPKEIVINEDAKIELSKYEQATTELYIKLHDAPSGPYISRLYEHAIKICLLYSMSMEQSVITKEAVEYAVELVESCYHNSLLIRNTIVNSGRVTGPWARVEACLKKHGEVTHGDLQRWTDIPKRELEPILESMIEDGTITKEIATTSRNGRSVRKYKLFSSTLQ